MTRLMRRPALQDSEQADPQPGVFGRFPDWGSPESRGILTQLNGVVLVGVQPCVERRPSPPGLQSLIVAVQRRLAASSHTESRKRGARPPLHVTIDDAPWHFVELVENDVAARTAYVFPH